MSSISRVASQCSSHGVIAREWRLIGLQVCRKLQKSWQYISLNSRLSKRVKVMPVSTPCHNRGCSGLRTIEWASFFRRQRFMVVIGASPTMAAKTLVRVLGLTWHWLASSVIAKGPGKCCSNRLADFLRISAAEAKVEGRTRTELMNGSAKWAYHAALLRQIPCCRCAARYILCCKLSRPAASSCCPPQWQILLAQLHNPHKQARTWFGRP